MVVAKEHLTSAERFEVMQMMFGAQSDEYDYHKVGLNQDFLFRFLHRAGFRSAERVADLGCFDDTSCYRFKGVPISLNVIAYK
jgi:predicted SAM-dependent methyltransferase